jgi:hypothetical protein
MRMYLHSTFVCNGSRLVAAAGLLALGSLSKRIEMGYWRMPRSCHHPITRRGVLSLALRVWCMIPSVIPNESVQLRYWRLHRCIKILRWFTRSIMCLEFHFLRVLESVCWCVFYLAVC